MDAAVVHTLGEPPRFGRFDDPVPQRHELLVEVTAAAITNIAKMRAAGTHYSAHTELPAVPGLDGVGRLEDGRRIYFGGARVGSMAELSLVSADKVAEVPDGLDDVSAAALLNPGVSAWLSLTRRAQLQPGQRVLVLGATGVTGRLAVQIAHILGASEVVAAGRNPESLAQVVELGATSTIALDQSDLASAFAAAAGDNGFDVVIDYLWGAPMEALLSALVRNDLTTSTGTTRIVHVGEMAGPTIALPGGVLRSRDVEIVGHGTGTMPASAEVAATFSDVLGAAAAGDLQIDTEAVPLREVEQAWTRNTAGTRLVLVP